jgi:hypothetical protein
MSHGDDDDDDAQLRSLRAVWLAMPDEDPPERGLDALLAAARTKAVELAAASSELPAAGPGEPLAAKPIETEVEPSWWRRLVASLRRPPMLALATVVVLVAGAALVGHRDMKATAPSGGSAPSKEDVPTELYDRSSLQQEAPPPPSVPSDPGAALGAGNRVAPHVPDEGTTESAKGEAQDNRWQAVTIGGQDTAADAKNDKVDEAAKNKLLDQAKTAAARGDCTSARTVARQLEQQDLGYYRSRVAPDRGIADCLVGRASASGATSATQPAE